MTGSMLPRPNGRGGFSLIEVLVALGIFALVALLGVTLIQAGVDGRAVLDARSAELRALQLARAILREDIAQLAARPARGAAGDQPMISFEGGRALEGEPFLTFVRHGWANPGDAQRRSTLQHVSYRIEDGQLIRQSRALLDPAPGLEPTDRVLLREVELSEVAFFGGGQWQPGWLAGPPPDARLPQAVRLTLEISRLGRIDHLFLAAAS